MTNALLSTNKIMWGYPKATFTETTEIFKADSYTVRVPIGINPHVETYDIQWTNLTDTEATALKAQFQSAAGANVIDWQPPLVSSSQKFTCATHSFAQLPGPSSRWQAMAQLVRAYDNG